MQFLNPQFLWLLLLGLLPVALYLFRRKSKTVNVSTLVFFKTLAREHQESAWLRRLKKWLSFLMTMLILSLVVFVLARLIAKQDDPDQYQTVVILLDRSASMGMTRENGETVLEAGKRVLRERLEKVPNEIGTALIAYDSRPEVVQPRTFTRRELISRLDSVEVRPISDDRQEAFETAKLIAGLEKPAVIWHVSDRPLSTSRNPEPGETEAEGGEGIAIRELLLAAEDTLNVGITSFQIRPVPLEYSRYEVFLQVALNAAATEGTTTRLEVSVGGIPNQFREIDLEPGDRVGMTFRLTGSSEQIMHLRLKTAGDRFGIDDELKVLLPAQQPVLAAWIRPDDREDPYTRFALSSIQESGRFELLKGTPDAWPLNEKVDAVIFDGWLPETWPSDLPAIVINPPGSVGPVLARALEQPIPYDSIRVANEDHPVLFRIASTRLALTQTAVFESVGALEPLWIAGNDSILSAGEIGGQRLVIFGFSPGMSERLPLTASFPLLMGNALLWAVDRESGDPRLDVLPTGALSEVSSEAVEWSSFDGETWRPERVSSEAGVIEMDRVGLWKSGETERGSAYPLSAGESDLPTSGITGDREYFSGGASSGSALRWWILGAIGFFLLLESFLFHRYAVY